MGVHVDVYRDYMCIHACVYIYICLYVCACSYEVAFACIGLQALYTHSRTGKDLCTYKDENILLAMSQRFHIAIQ